ncbi:exosome complex component RRP45A-like isoform X1 [Musa acuminata AAA Group]|uniref:exosome complex component RRP45A-like isoform X1 n=1 Tax=Musa acuminata AAA Group TaxID=214697 RepID=UPI0031D42C24
MEQRLASTWRMTVNERKFVETALASDLRVDGRRPFDYRRLTIKFGREDGSSEVQLGQTHVIGFVTSQLVQPYRDRPNEGTLSIFTEFSPMADPSFEAGRPGESAIELGRVVDRGLRESRAVDMESLCVVAGKSVWSIRVDLHILDNGGNLIDAANIAALAALSTFRRPECTLGGENGQDIIVHDPEVMEPLTLIIHHLPIAVTFAFFSEGNIMVIDPTHKEEVVMGGRMTATVNSNGDVCAVQKAGGEGVTPNMIMQCLRIASVKAADITSKIKNAVETYNTERTLRKVKRHSSTVTQQVSVPDVIMKDKQAENIIRHQEEMTQHEPDRSSNCDDEMTVDTRTCIKTESNRRDRCTDPFVGGPSNWDPYLNKLSSNLVGKSQDLLGPLTISKEQQEESKSNKMAVENSPEHATISSNSETLGVSGPRQQTDVAKSLKDAVKSKARKKSKTSATT